MLGFSPGSRPAITARKSSSADTQITTASQLPASSARLLKAMQLQFRRQRRGFAGGAIPHAGQQARAVKIARHVRTHGTQSDEACLHTPFPTVNRSEA